MTLLGYRSPLRRLDEKQLRKLVTLGADAILTDDPALLRRIVTEGAEKNRERARSR